MPRKIPNTEVPVFFQVRVDSLLAPSDCFLKKPKYPMVELINLRGSAGIHLRIVLFGIMHDHSICAWERK